MAVRTPHSELIRHLEDAVAMEEAVLRSLNNMVASTEDGELRGHLQRHVGETELHAARLRGRLEGHGAAGESPLRELAGQLGALVKGVVDNTRETTTARNARDAYVSEHLEIAAYELLERVARMAGDEATADIARMNREDERAMAEAIATSWDRVAVAGMREDGALMGGAPGSKDPLSMPAGRG
jgi:ferritin-like metal-binding protein YciE